MISGGTARTPRATATTGMTVHDPRGAGRLPAMSVTLPIVTMYVAPGWSADAGTNVPVSVASS